MIAPDLIETPHTYATEAELWACAEDLAERFDAPAPTPQPSETEQ